MKSWGHLLGKVVLCLGGWMGVQAALADTITYFHNDISGTPMAATDASGNLLWKESYRPYGDRRTNSAAATSNNKLWYAGKSQDANTGLLYMGARYYDPVLGRFYGVDPKGFDEKNIQSFNRYAYANNNPYKYVDPDGHSPLDVAFLAVDLGKLGYSLYKGDGIKGAFADVGLSVIGVVVPVPGAGQAIKAVRAAEHGVEAIRAGEKVADAAKGTKTAAEAAEGLAKELGHNRVSARTAGGKQVDIDLAGKGHFDKATGKVVETPHVHTSDLNVGPNGKVSASNTSVREATMEDVRTAKKISERK